MRVSDQFLDQTIAHVAVMTNRPVWLDPKHLDIQRGVWRNLFAAQHRLGRVTIGDVEAATVECAKRSRSGQHNALLPDAIVADAVRRAAERFDRIGHLLMSFDEDHHVVVAFLDAVRDRHPDALAARVEALQDEIRNSGHPPERIAGLLGYVRRWHDGVSRPALT